MKLLANITIELNTNASTDTVISIKKYVPGATHVYGVKNPVLNDIAAKYKSGGFELILELWNSGSYEEKIIAAKLIRKVCIKNPIKALELVEQFSKDIDNWALCDTLDMQSLKPVNKKISKEIFAVATKFSVSDNMWQKRLSLVLVENFCKQKVFHPAIKKLIALQKSGNEHYIRKAVEWLERNLNKQLLKFNFLICQKSIS